MRSFSLLLIGCLLLAGCGEIVRPSGRAVQAPPREAISRPNLLVEPLDGPARPLAKLLAEAVALELAQGGLAAATAPTGASEYVLRGRTETNLADRDIPFTTIIHWTLFDPKGAVVGIYSQGVEGSRLQWEYGDPVIIRAVGKGAATPILALLREDATEVPVAAPLRTALLVKPVLGAPSDGNQMLTRAINAAVQQAGYEVTEEPAQAGYVLEGLVDVDQPQQGLQKVRIVWKVTTGDGRQGGFATLENTLPTESLAGPWDRAAVSIVAAVFPSIDQMLEGAKKYRVDTLPSQMPIGGRPSGSAEPAGPPTPPLPRVPGRAPPPN